MYDYNYFDYLDFIEGGCMNDSEECWEENDAYEELELGFGDIQQH